jgi:hypothetical protein
MRWPKGHRSPHLAQPTCTKGEKFCAAGEMSVVPVNGAACALKTNRPITLKAPDPIVSRFILFSSF